MFYNHTFKSDKYIKTWQCIVSNTFENMELFYRKQFTMQRLLSYYRKAFHIAPITLKNCTDDRYYEKKLLAIYLLTKYSNEDFESIANEFHISEETVILIYSNDIYETSFKDEIKLFFKQFEIGFLEDRHASLALQENIEQL